MVEAKTRIELTDAQLLRLDGIDRSIQVYVDNAHKRAALSYAHPELTAEQIRFIAAIVAEVASSGKCVHRHKALDYCKVCGAVGGFAKRKRATWAGPAGSDIRSKPLSISGVEFIDKIVTIRGSSSSAACAACTQVMIPVLVEQLAEVCAEIPSSLGGGRYQRWDNCKCSACGWEGHRGQLGLVRTLMNNGRYPGECPACKATNKPLGPTVIEDTDGFQVVAAQPDTL